ncbi:hypothetical protein VKT23_009087 [Stygiomarasmius scandens]|uniref:Uncharacterized protein n=1 Tax=Marasmiellus scandens TaxID=2682957 RepID=A0ABR1JIR1_9AGAR
MVKPPPSSPIGKGVPPSSLAQASPQASSLKPSSHSSSKSSSNPSPTPSNSGSVSGSSKTAAEITNSSTKDDKHGKRRHVSKTGHRRSSKSPQETAGQEESGSSADPSASTDSSASTVKTPSKATSGKTGQGRVRSAAPSTGPSQEGNSSSSSFRTAQEVSLNSPSPTLSSPLSSILTSESSLREDEEGNEGPQRFTDEEDKGNYLPLLRRFAEVIKIYAEPLQASIQRYYRPFDPNRDYDPLTSFGVDGNGLLPG